MIEYENLQKLNAPFFDQYKASFSGLLESGWFILGKQVAAFEEAYASYCGSKHAVGVASGLDALFLALKAFDFPAGKEVIVPANTYIATILAILNAGLKPVLAEPDLCTYNIDPADIVRKISPDTVAVLVVHLYGKCCAMDEIGAIAHEHGLRIIEDCAQAHGAAFHGKKAGAFGDCGAHSFYPTKNLGALGDAGAITTDSDELAEKLRTLRNYGSRVKYFNDYIGVNSRLDEVQAGFLQIKLKALNEINEHKRRLAAIYFEELADNDQFILPSLHTDYHDVYHIFTIRSTERDRLRDYLLEKGIKTEIHYPCAPHKQKAMQGLLPEGPFPISEEIHATTLSLPASYFHQEADIITVAKALRAF